MLGTVISILQVLLSLPWRVSSYMCTLSTQELSSPHLKSLCVPLLFPIVSCEFQPLWSSQTHSSFSSAQKVHSASLGSPHPTALSNQSNGTISSSIPSLESWGLLKLTGPKPLSCILIRLAGSWDSWPRNKSTIFTFPSAFRWKLVI